MTSHAMLTAHLTLHRLHVYSSSQQLERKQSLTFYSTSSQNTTGDCSSELISSNQVNTDFPQNIFFLSLKNAHLLKAPVAVVHCARVRNYECSQEINRGSISLLSLNATKHILLSLQDVISVCFQQLLPHYLHAQKIYGTALSAVVQDMNEHFTMNLKSKEKITSVSFQDNPKSQYQLQKHQCMKAFNVKASSKL